MCHGWCFRYIMFKNETNAFSMFSIILKYVYLKTRENNNHDYRYFDLSLLVDTNWFLERMRILYIMFITIYVRKRLSKYYTIVFCNKYHCTLGKFENNSFMQKYKITISIRSGLQYLKLIISYSLISELTAYGFSWLKHTWFKTGWKLVICCLIFLDCNLDQNNIKTNLNCILKCVSTSTHKIHKVFHSNFLFANKFLCTKPCKTWYNMF